jgi:signal transduction histidine kinase
VISDVAGDYINQIKDSDGNVNLVYELDKKQAKEGKEQQQIPDHTILVEADKERIAQVISNLISNAIKFTKGGAISITTKIESSGRDYCQYKGHCTRNRHRVITKALFKVCFEILSGYGLGLFISKSIVEAHGGRICAENNKNGQGATFAFSLPIS